MGPLWIRLLHGCLHEECLMGLGSGSLVLSLTSWALKFLWKNIWLERDDYCYLLHLAVVLMLWLIGGCSICVWAWFRGPRECVKMIWVQCAHVQWGLSTVNIACPPSSWYLSFFLCLFFFVCLYALGTVHYRWVGTHLTQLWFPPLLQFIHCTVPSFWLNMLCSWYFSKFWQPWVKLSKKSIKWWTTHSCTWINNSSSEIWCLSRIYGFEILQGWEKITEGQHSSVSGLYSW